MDKTIALVVSASVILVGALIAITITSGNLSDLQRSTDDVQSQGCDFQIQKAQEDPDYRDDLSANCQQQFQQSQQEQQFIGGVIGQLGSSE